MSHRPGQAAVPAEGPDKEPDFLLALWTQAGCLAGLSRHDEAVAHLDNLVGLTDRLPLSVGMLGQAHAHAGQRAEAELRELLERLDGEYVPMVALSWIAMALGDAGRAFGWPEREYEDRGVFLFFAGQGVWFDDFRADPLIPSSCGATGPGARQRSEAPPVEAGQRLR